MLKWKRVKGKSRDLVLLNPDDIEPDRLDSIFEELREAIKDNYQEISKPLIEGLLKFYETFQDGETRLILEYKCYSRILRWIITSGNKKYDSEKYSLWRDALAKLWKYLFGECFHEFRVYQGEHRYRDDRVVWEEWFGCINSCPEKETTNE